MHYFIDKHGFDVDFYKPQAKLTLLHVIAKFHRDEFSDYDKEHIRNLIKKSNNLFLKNNFGRTIIRVAKVHNCQANIEFFITELKLAVRSKIIKVTYNMHKIMKERNHRINKHIVRHIYQYIDG
jgi:hypothetical protein